MRRKIVIGGAIVLAFLALVATRVVVSSRKEYLKANKYLRLGHLDEAVVRYRRSARWYAPGNPYVSRSLRQLWRIGKLAEKKGKRRLALDAYRSIRAAVLGTRSFYTPHEEWLAKVNPTIARLMAAEQTEAGGSKPEGVEDLQKWHLEQLQETTAPSVGWSVLAVVGLIVWIAGGFAFAYKAISPDDQLLVRPAVICTIAILGGLAAWMIGLSFA
jgi:hypothetical protein